MAGLPPGMATLTNTSQFALFSIFLHRSLHYRCAVSNPEEANAFFIPYDVFGDRMGNFYQEPEWMKQQFDPDAHCRAAMRLYQALATATPQGERWLQRHQGRDHFVVNRFMVWKATCPGITWATTPGDFFDNTVKLELEGQVVGNRLVMGTLPEVAAETGLPASVLAHTLPAHHSHSVPYPSFFHDATAAGVTAPSAFPWAPQFARRNMLAMYGGGMHGIATTLRGKLGKTCFRDKRCQLVGVPHERAERNASWFSTLARAMLGATFCLQPTGDSPSRKGMVDSVLLGCIPVLFEGKQLTLWPWHWHAPNVSAYVEGAAVLNGTLNVMDELARIPVSRVRELQEAGRAIAYQMQYSLGDVVGRRDAFDVIMERLGGMMPRRSSKLL